MGEDPADEVVSTSSTSGIEGDPVVEGDPAVGGRSVVEPVETTHGEGDPAVEGDPVVGGRSVVEPVETTHEEAGLDLARQVARGLAGRTGERRRRPGRQVAPRRSVPPQASGAHPDDRDPQTIDATLGRFVLDQGWETELRVHGVFARWEAIVGREVGQHVRPETLADGRLTVRTESTAWATQMRLLAADVVRRLNEVLGDGTVTAIDVRGPRPPSWTRGRLRVKGRGPRDTYG